MKKKLSQVDIEKIEAFKTFLNNFTRRALEKFTKGCLEHDEDFFKLDFDKEIENEIVDQLAYMWGKRITK